MQIQRKQAFTLVELIVVITIMAILWTIAFISFQWYSRSARDSRRISDVQNLKKALEIYQVQSSRYPIPSTPTDIEYLWTTIRTQWTIWDSVATNLSKILSKKPIDPLTDSEYTYSVLNTWLEYELWLIREDSSVLSNNTNIYLNTQTYASNIQAYVTWNYNWQVAKVSIWAVDYILAIPSIINWDITVSDIIEIIEQKTLVYDGYDNIPYSYLDNSIFEIDWWFDYVAWDVVVYSWSLEDLEINEVLRVNFIEALEQAYDSTPIVTDDSWIENITNLEVDTWNPTVEVRKLAIDILTWYLWLEIWEEQYPEPAWCILDWIDINHWETQTWYILENIVWDDLIQTCENTSISRTCNEWVLSWESTYQYTTCSKWEPSICGAGSEIYNWHTYNTPELEHAWTWSVSNIEEVTNWDITYTATAQCNNWTVTISWESESLACDNNYHKVWSDAEETNVCISNTRSCTITNWTWTETYDDESGWSSCELTGCNQYYHTEDNTTCISNTKEVICWWAQDPNSIATNGTTYEQERNWTMWTTSESSIWWEDQLTCDYDCNNDYVWNNIDSCILNTTSCTVTNWSWTKTWNDVNWTYDECIVNQCDQDYYKTDTSICSEVWNWYYSTSTSTTRIACTNNPDTASRNYTYDGSWWWANSCSATYAHLCWVDFYETTNWICSTVTNWYYSPTTENNRTVCSNTIPTHSIYSSTWWWTNACEYICDAWYSWTSCTANSCSAGPQTVNGHTYSVPLLTSWATGNVTSNNFAITNWQATYNQTFACNLWVVTTSWTENTLTVTQCTTDFYVSWTSCITVWDWYYSTSTSTTRTACTNNPDTASRNYTYNGSWWWANSCSATYADLCWVDFYETANWTCTAVWNWNYSLLTNNSIYSCTNKPLNSEYTSDGNGWNACEYNCNTWYSWTSCTANSCSAGPQTVNGHTYSVPLLTSWATGNVTSNNFAITNWQATYNQTFACNLWVVTTSWTENTLTVTQCTTDFYVSWTNCITVWNWYYSNSTSTTRIACTNNPDTASRNYTYDGSWWWANSCSAYYTHLCWVDFYETINWTCTAVWNWNYSADLNNTISACTNNPDTVSRDYTYDSAWWWANLCSAYYTHLCWEDLYETANWTCTTVWVWNYSADLENAISACDNAPVESYYTHTWWWENACLYTCNNWYSWTSCTANSCSAGPQTVNGHTYSVPLLTSWATGNVTSNNFAITNWQATYNQTFACNLWVVTTSWTENTLTVTQCTTDFYVSWTNCITVWDWYYSTSTSTTRIGCSNKPTHSEYSSSGGWSNNCGFDCTNDYTWTNCEIEPDPANNINLDGSTTTYISDHAWWSNRFEFTSWSSAWWTSIVRDKVTWLYWQSEWITQWKMNWDNAKTYCAGLSLWWYTDWRLPDYTELWSIVDLSKYYSSIDTTYFTANNNDYWSSTTTALSTSHAWVVNFYNGNTSYFNKTTNFDVRCIR